MNRVSTSSTKVAVVLSLAASALFARPAAAEVTIMKSDTWDLYTTGRVDAFFSGGWGDSNPVPLAGTANLSPGGLDVGTDNIPRLDATGAAIPNSQGTFQSMRLRSGFVPNVFGFGMRRRINEDTTLKIYIALWATIESDGQRKTDPISPDAREGYLKVEGPWGSVLAGRALDLFSRGATENDFLYGHGYGVGFPGNINSLGPTAGLINFGVMAAFFSPGLVYGTPTAGGLQLTAGVYDPTPLQGSYEGTRSPRPEGELTYDLHAGSFRMHLFANGEFQKVYGNGNGLTATSYGVGYGGRFEVGPVHLGLAGAYGPGLGLGYALEPDAVSVSQNFQLRTFDGYSAIAQVSQPKFDVNFGGGISRVFELQEDVNMMESVLKRQIGVFVAFVWHFTDYLHYDIDALHGDALWYRGEKQQFTFINTGLTATW
jgi:porin-like protein